LLGYDPLKLVRLKGFLSLTRPPNGLMMALAVFVGYYVEAGRPPHPLEGVLAAITAYTLSASSMVINDVVDRDIDALNNPRRPIPSGVVTPREAQGFAVVLAAFGVSSSAFLGVLPLTAASLFYTLAISYNLFLKRRGVTGNIAVSGTIVAPYIYGALLASGGVGLNVSIISALSFLAGLGREIVKGIPDVEGDARRGVRTLAASHGEMAAALLGSVLIWIAVALSPLPLILGTMNLLYAPPIAIADAFFTYSNMKLLKNTKSARRVKDEYLAWMSIALVGFLLGSIR